MKNMLLHCYSANTPHTAKEDMAESLETPLLYLLYLRHLFKDELNKNIERGSYKKRN